MVAMPRISTFFGIVITMYFDDHPLPHFHAVRGAVCIGQEGVFIALRDPAYFAQVRVDAEIGTITWPNGADLAPEVLYDRAAAHPVRQPGRAAAG